VSSTSEITAPWVGGRGFIYDGRTFGIKGPLPPEVGWHRFEIDGSRKCRWLGAGEEDWEFEQKAAKLYRGYMVGDRILTDGLSSKAIQSLFHLVAVPAFFVPLGLPRFTRALVGESADKRLLFIREEFPVGPENEVLEAFQDHKDDVLDIKNVTPALHLAFLFETRQRAEAEERERVRQEEIRLAEVERVRLEQREELIRQVGTGDGRRELAAVDFGAAAKAALSLTGAELLDQRPSRVANEMVVQFLYQTRRFECTVDKTTLRVIDSGICLTDESSGERGDSYFTLESLPTVIGEAMRHGLLHVYRRVP